MVELYHFYLSLSSMNVHCPQLLSVGPSSYCLYQQYPNLG